MVDAESVRSGKTQIVAPTGFMKEALSENVLAGAVMGRRAQYMYGNNLSRDARGHVDTGLGKGPAVGGLSIIAPTVSIDRTGQELDIDGVHFVFQYVPESEAPAELTFFLPRFQAFCGAEIVSHTMHNLYTLRGAKVRDASKWSGYIDEAIDLFGADTEVVFNSHHWPVWGNAQVLDYLKKQRDMYAFIHDQTLHLASAGLTPRQIAETIKLPKSLEDTFADRGYYGTLKHNAKAVYQFYFGWFDGNPANLDPLPPQELGKRYVDAIGGSAKVLAARADGLRRRRLSMGGNAARQPGIRATATDRAAKDLLARTYDQLGYRAESGPWRDFYLTGAQELRHGVDAASPGLGGLLGSVPIESVFAAMATQIDGAAADGKHITVNVTFTDLKRSFVLELENSVLHHKEMQPVQGRRRDGATDEGLLAELPVEAGVGEGSGVFRCARYRRRPARAGFAAETAAAGNAGIPDRHAGIARAVSDPAPVVRGLTEAEAQVRLAASRATTSCREPIGARRFGSLPKCCASRCSRCCSAAVWCISRWAI